MGGKKVGAPENLIIGNKRLDDRTPEDFRPMEMSVGILKHAIGSATFNFGNTRALAGVFGPRAFHPKFLQDPQKAVLRLKYAMAPFSTLDRSRPGHSRRSMEISKVATDALASVVFVEDYPRTGIDVFVEILQADASTRCAGINAASLALADAGVPMRNLITSCSVGKIDGILVLDIGGLEDNFGEVDMAVSMIADQDKFVHLQMDGIVTKEEWGQLLTMAREGCGEIYKKMAAALRERYATTMEGV